MLLDVARLLEPVTADTPCGEDLQYRVAPLLDRAKGTTRSEFVNGRQEQVVTPPDWSELSRDAVKLAGQVMDLRLWAMLARAALQRDGLPGLAAGLRLIAEGLDRYWPDLHPPLELEESDPEQQTWRRRNAVQLLVDPVGLLLEVQRVPLLRAKGFGQFSLRAMRLAAGEVQPGKGEEKPQPQLIEAAIREARPEEAAEREATRAAAVELPGLVQRIQALFAAKAGTERAAPELEDLARLGTEIARRLPAPPVVETAPEVEAAPAAEAAMNGAGSTGGLSSANGHAAPSARHDIAGREDVLRQLDLMLAYYREREPSSPVPLLLERARRLVPMSFVEAMQDLAPSGIGELTKVTGRLDGPGP